MEETGATAILISMVQDKATSNYSEESTTSSSNERILVRITVHFTQGIYMTRIMDLSKSI